jgi:hypothetical protein
MRNILQTVALSAVLLVPAASVNAQVRLGIQIGEPPPPRAYRVPPRPRPDYEWIEGYQAPQGKHYRWHNGRWARPPYRGAYWVEPYHVNGQYYSGRWEGNRSDDRRDNGGNQNNRRR